MTSTPSTWLVWRVRVDRGVALLGGLLASPVVAVLAVLVLVVDRQRPLVGLRRIGRDGTPFTLWKLRTMRTTAEDAPAFTVRDDQRVTALGARLRRYRVDELPQLWNVVKGDMALLGPRPESPDYVDAASPAWAAVLRTRPGIAGPTQVVIHAWEAEVTSVEVYRGEVLPRKLEIDAWYVASASPAVDLEVTRSVLRSVRRPQQATPVHDRLARELPDTLAAIDAGSARP